MVFALPTFSVTFLLEDTHCFLHCQLAWPEFSEIDPQLHLLLATSVQLSPDRIERTTEQCKGAQEKGNMYFVGSSQGRFSGKCQPASCIQ